VNDVVCLFPPAAEKSTMLFSVSRVLAGLVANGNGEQGQPTNVFKHSTFAQAARNRELF